MGDVRNEPSMEDILASIKRIIAEDGAAAVGAPRSRSAPRGDPRPAGPAPAEPLPALHPAAPDTPDAVHDAVHDTAHEAVLELTDPAPPAPAASLVSANAASASRQSLAALSAVVVRPDPEAETQPANTLEALVRELLRPLLKEWLDAKLPELVESLVAREIARITGTAI